MTHITIEKAKLEQWILKVIRTTKHVNNEAFVEVMMMRDDMNEVLKQALAAPVQEPVAGKGKELSEQLKLCARNVAFVAAGRVDMSSAAMQEMFALIDHVCVGLDSPPAQPAPAQEGRDWSLLEATQESLREHMAEIKRLKEAQAAPVQEPLSELEKDAANLLFALHDAWPYVHGRCTIESKKKAIQALMIKHGDFADLHPPAAQPAPTVQEPVAWVDLLKQAEEIVRSKPLWKKYIDGTPLANDIAVWMASFAQEHTTPPAAQRQWVGLTDEERGQAINANFGTGLWRMAKDIEDKLKEKNT